MLSEETARRTFYIYKCIAKRDDGTILERIIKIQSFFNIEDLAIALEMLSDAPGQIEKFRVQADDYDVSFSFVNKLYEDGFAFCDLEEDKKIIIDIFFDDGVINKYECEYVGRDTLEKKITRTTPICISASGYSRCGYDKYIEDEQNSWAKYGYKIDSNDPRYKISYYEIENRQLDWSVRDLKRLFNCYKEDYYNRY